MPLDDEYLKYPRRERGQDIDRYAWSPAPGRKPARFRNGERLGVSIVVPLEYFPLTPSGKPFKHPGAMATPYPDLRHYTTRDYGNRVGVFRLLSAFRAANVRATFAINAVLLPRVAPLIEAIVSDGHEVAAHGLSTDAIHWGDIDPATERDYVAKTREAFDLAGISPKTWLSPARQQSRATLDVLGAHGFEICLDWEADTVPLPMKTNGGDVTAFPLLNELDDRFLLATKHQDEESWRDQIVEASEMMATEAKSSGAECFGFTMTPYVAGQPFRVWAVREILEKVSGVDGAFVAPVSEICDSFLPEAS
ncbi:MAG: polysaccharide deacetylase family protein [Pseudomonadota bacterium]